MLCTFTFLSSLNITPKFKDQWQFVVSSFVTRFEAILLQTTDVNLRAADLNKNAFKLLSL